MKTLMPYIVVLGLFFGLIFLDSYSDHIEVPKEVKEISFYGVFVRGFNNHDRQGEFVVFDDSTRQSFDFYYSSLKSISPGDTLIKNVGTLKLIVKRGGEQFVFYPNYFGETFYDSTTN